MHGVSIPSARSPPLAPLAHAAARRPDGAGPAGSGFARLLQGMIAQNAQASAAADAAVSDLATGQAQDLHTVSWP